MGKDVYERLLDDEDFDRELLVNTIEPYVKIGRNSKDVIFRDRFEELTNKEKIIIYLLAKKGLEDLTGSDHLEFPQTIASSTNVNSNTVRTILNRLKKDDLVKKRSGGNYEVPNYRVEEVAEEVD